MSNPPSEASAPEAILREMIAEAHGPEDASNTLKRSREALINGLFQPREWPTPPPAQFPRLENKSERRSDFIIAALGVALGLTCALFPWYIFFNQEQFGIQTIKFGGKGNGSGRAVASQSASAMPAALPDLPGGTLDLFITGHIDRTPQKAGAPGPDEQPFPGEAAEFQLLHVANGRAMIADDKGIWLVQRGDRLPDSSRVAAIEKRNGKWVLVTSTDRVVEQ
jgi:hypothetical protein